MDELVKIVAKYFIVLSVVGTLVLLLRLKPASRKQYIAVLVIGGVLAGLLAVIASQLYHNPRPFIQGNFMPLLPHDNDNGFVSDHTLLAATLGWAALVFSRKMGIALLLLAALIGASRMAAGLHHLIDVIGGFVCAGIAVWLAKLLVWRYVSRKTPKTPPIAPEQV